MEPSVPDIIRNVLESSLMKRFWLGELRLTRLNNIYQVSHGSLRGYRIGYDHFRRFFESRSGSPLVLFNYIIVALTAI